MVNPRIVLLFLAGVFGACLMGCMREELKPIVSNLCGGSVGSSALDGLSWVAGSPTQPNVLCQVQQSKASIIYALEPESRDPVLFDDPQSSFQLLVERFSGRQSRPSRVTWFSSGGERLGQRGDWPQNVYGISRLSTDNAIVAGFDFGVIQQVGLNLQTFAAPKEKPFSLSAEGPARPVHLLSNDVWLAAIDNGYDLIRFKPEVAMIFQVSSVNGLERRQATPVKDNRTGGTCENAFQAFALTKSSVLLSCNPQYFGPAAGQSVALFEVSLASDGEVLSRELVRLSGTEVQKIEIFGTDNNNEHVFLGYKTTTKEDYNGALLRAGWMNLLSGEWIPEVRFAGPLRQLGQGRGSVVACQFTSSKCQAGRFLHLIGNSPWSPEISSSLALLSPELPFLSFAQDIKHK